MITEQLQQRLTQHKEALLDRQRPVVERRGQNKISVAGQSCIDFSSNDYLGLNQHPNIIEALLNACRRYGFGSGASAFISGYSASHQATEIMFAEWLGVDKAVLFSSGYAANIGIMSALSKRSDTIFSDKLSHASLLDGIALSRAKHIRYPHNDLIRLTTLAAQSLPNLIVTDSVFSMEGDIAPILDLAQLAKQYHAGLIIDDAHGIGVLGKTGKGVSEHFALPQKNYSCLVIPLGKAFNAIGAIVAGRKEIMDTVLQFSRSYCYSTALPPACCVAIQASLAVIQQESWRQQRLQENIQFFIHYATERGLNLVAVDKTPIKSILVQDNERVLTLQKSLLAKGFYVSAIRPPTVPRGKARLRLSINSLHTQDQLAKLIDHIIEGMPAC